MNELEIEELIYSNPWHCHENKETIIFRRNDSDSFYIIKILNEVEVSRSTFERIVYSSANEFNSPNNKRLIFFPDYYQIEVISDEKIKVFLPGIDHLELCKVKN